MSKYNLTDLLSEVKGGRIGTLNITAMDLERKMEELEGEGIKVSTFDGDNFGKTYIEYHVHPENKYDPDESFSIYDYKFGEDPTDIDNVDKEYPFSIGGMSAALNSAKALLGAGQASYSIDEGEAVDLAIEASQEKAGIEVDESFKSLAKKLDKQKGIDKDEAAKIAGSIAAKKAAGAGKGPTAKQKKRMNEVRIESKYTLDSLSQDEYGKNYDDLDPEQQRYMRSELEITKGYPFSAGIDQDGYRLPEFPDPIKSINEVRIEREVANRIEGLMNIQLKAKFLDVFEDLWLDLIEEDPFYAEDVINHLNNEMHKRINDRQAQGDRLANTPEIPMFKGTRDALDDISIREEDNCEKHDYKQIDPDGTAECTKCGLKNSEPSRTGEKVRNEGKGVDFIRALKVDANGTKLEIKSYLESLKRSGDKFDSIDDYVEDFKNYVADKALQEHFGRFMKDYQ